MGLFRGLRSRRGASGLRRVDPRHLAHLENWTATHRGVEAFVEPKTTVTDTTVVLVAHDGEWTRRRVADPATAYALGRRLAIPVYDVALVGYPQRMRDYNARRRIIERRERDRER